MSNRTFVAKRGIATIPKATLNDPKLSWAALGILAAALNRDETAPQGYRAFIREGTGQKAVLNALKELTDAGYRWQIKMQSNTGKITTITVISEIPIGENEAQNIVDERLEVENETKKFSTGKTKNLTQQPQNPVKHPMRDEPTHRDSAARLKQDEKFSTGKEENEKQQACMPVNYPMRDEPTHRQTVARLHGAQSRIDDDLLNLNLKNHHQSEDKTENKKSKNKNPNFGSKSLGSESESKKTQTPNFATLRKPEDSSSLGFHRGVNLEVLFEKIDFMFPNVLEETPIKQLQKVVDEAFKKASGKVIKPNNFVNVCVENDLERFKNILKTQEAKSAAICPEHPPYFAHNCGGCKLEKLAVNQQKPVIPSDENTIAKPEHIAMMRQALAKKETSPLPMQQNTP